MHVCATGAQDKTNSPGSPPPPPSPLNVQWKCHGIHTHCPKLVRRCLAEIQIVRSPAGLIFCSGDGGFWLLMKCDALFCRAWW